MTHDHEEDDEEEDDDDDHDDDDDDDDDDDGQFPQDGTQPSTRPSPTWEVVSSSVCGFFLSKTSRLAPSKRWTKSGERWSLIV